MTDDTPAGGMRERIEDICYHLCFDRYSPNIEKGITDIAALVAEARRQALQDVMPKIDEQWQRERNDYYIAKGGSMDTAVLLIPNANLVIQKEIDRLSSPGGGE